MRREEQGSVTTGGVSDTSLENKCREELVEGTVKGTVTAWAKEHWAGTGLSALRARGPRFTPRGAAALTPEMTMQVSYPEWETRLWRGQNR